MKVTIYRSVSTSSGTVCYSAYEGESDKHLVAVDSFEIEAPELPYDSWQDWVADKQDEVRQAEVAELKAKLADLEAA